MKSKILFIFSLFTVSLFTEDFSEEKTIQSSESMKEQKETIEESQCNRDVLEKYYFDGSLQDSLLPIGLDKYIDTCTKNINYIMKYSPSKKGICITGKSGKTTTLCTLLQQFSSQARVLYLDIEKIVALNGKNAFDEIKSIFQALSEKKDDWYIVGIDDVPGDYVKDKKIYQELLFTIDLLKDSKVIPILCIDGVPYQEVSEKFFLKKRFGRQFLTNISSLTYAEGEVLVKALLKGINVEKGFDYEVVCDLISSLNPERHQIQSIISDALLNAYKDSPYTPILSMQNVYDSLLRFRNGERSSYEFTKNVELLTAYHEAGHVLVALFHPFFHRMNFKCVHIIPHGSCGGCTFVSKKEVFDVEVGSKQDSKAYLAALMGGYVAEELSFGLQTGGPSSDLEVATDYAQHMICKLGMGSRFLSTSVDLKDLDKTIVDEIEDLLKEQYQAAKRILIEHKDKLDILAHELCEKKVLSQKHVYKVLGINDEYIKSVKSTFSKK